MKGAKLHDALAKRRDDEAFRMEKMRSVDKYFDDWTKITNRHEQWTTPEYYRLADQKIHDDEEQRSKAKDLEARRQKLKARLDSESKQYAKEIEELNKPKVRQVSMRTLKGINETYKRTEEEKRRLDVESQLYKRWRNSPQADSILSSAKSNNEALAKMNWLDKQINNQIEKEKLEQQRASDRIRLMEDFRTTDEILSARKAERDQELAKLKTFQSQQLDELRTRESESDRLHRKETELNECIEQLRTELSKLNEHMSSQIERIHLTNNLRHIKMQLRNLSETVLRDLYYDCELLERLGAHEHIDEKQLHRIRHRFDEQIESEMQILRQIECMYESEAKSFAMHQQDIWLTECKTRESILRDLINNHVQQLSNEIDFVGRRQRELVDMRDCHRRAIDSSNDRIENLLSANSTDERVKNTEGLREVLSPISSDIVKHINDEICLPDLFSKKVVVSESGTTPISTGRPEFGRKRVVWT